MEEETQAFKQLVEEERYRAKLLEEQLNDLSELHQHEVTNIKQVRTKVKISLALTLMTAFLNPGHRLNPKSE